MDLTATAKKYTNYLFKSSLVLSNKALFGSFRAVTRNTVPLWAF